MSENNKHRIVIDMTVVGVAETQKDLVDYVASELETIRDAAMSYGYADKFVIRQEVLDGETWRPA